MPGTASVAPIFWQLIFGQIFKKNLSFWQMFAEDDINGKKLVKFGVWLKIWESETPKTEFLPRGVRAEIVVKIFTCHIVFNLVPLAEFFFTCNYG